jgi:Fe-S cluster assembly protein SufD
MMETSVKTNPAKENFLNALEGHSSALTKFEPLLVAQHQERLSELDFPTSRVEDWKYTRTARISTEQWKIENYTGKIDVEPYLIPQTEATVLVFVNGFWNESLSNIKEQKGISITREISDLNTFSQFNTWLEAENKNIFQTLRVSHCTDTLFIKIEKGICAAHPIHIIHLQQGENNISLPAIFVLAEEKSELNLIESFVGNDQNAEKHLCSRSIHVDVKKNAIVNFDKIQLENDLHFSIAEENIQMEEHATFTINTLTVDGGWIRNNLNITINGRHCEANLHGFYLPRRKQLVDNHTFVDHKVPDCNSNELYKGILNDQSTGVFNGKVFVRPDAQKTNAYQNNSNVLLSEDAQMFTKPELEIYADDVKCSHGTSTGQMDEDAVFYLRARGLSEDGAKKLLTSAFINDVIGKVKSDAVREYVLNELHKRQLLVD